MKNQEWIGWIQEFALTRSESFDFGALAEYVEKKGEKLNEDDEDRLFNFACDSDDLFEDDREIFSDRFIPRHAVFKGAEFLVTPLPEEVAGGFLIPGHRFMPFLSREVFPAKAMIKLPNGSIVPTRTIQLYQQLAQRFLMFFGPYGTADYLLADHEENIERIAPPYEADVEMTVFDLKAFFEQCGFKAGDSLMLTVEDWLKGVFSVRYVPVKQGSVDFVETREWIHALRLGFEESHLEGGMNDDCYEQLSKMLWLAECNKDAPSVLFEPPLSLAAFFNTQKDLMIQTTGEVSFFWPEDEPMDSRWLNSLGSDDLEPESELEAFFQLLGLSLNLDEAEAYMRDALSRGEKDPNAVLSRVIHGRTLSFPTAKDEKDFQSLWLELWNEVRAAYVLSKDTHHEMRSVFLELNDQCLRVLRELDRGDSDPFVTMGQPASMQLGELNALIHSVLVMCNQGEAMGEELPLPLDEMARDMSAAITELSQQLIETGSAGSFDDYNGPIYQLKISLKDARPPIWRRVLVPASIELEELHDVIQAAFGWQDYHLHQFVDGKTYYQPGGGDEGLFGMSVADSYGVSLRKLLRKERDKIGYEYDFGDSWKHDVVLEKVLPAAPEQPLPICIKGKRACPPEDCGGTFGYEQLLETLAGSDCEEKEELLDWLGGPIDSEVFDLDEINSRLRIWS